MLFFNFCLFLFPKSQITIVRNLIMDFEGSYDVTDIFYRHVFDNETTALLKNFEICTKMNYNHDKKNKQTKKISTSFLIIDLKCTVEHYANLNSSPINKPFFNYGPLNKLFLQFLIYVYFNEIFVKNFMKKLSIFNKNVHDSFQDVA